MVLGDSGERIADEADAPRLQVGLASEIVDDVESQRIGEQRIDGEVAAGGVLAPVVGVGDGGAAAVGGDVASQGRHLDRLARHDGGDRAVGEPGRNRLDPGLAEPIHHLLRRQSGGEVDVADRKPEQRVADAAADIARVAVPGAERREQGLHPFPPLPGRLGKLHSASSSRRDRLTIIAAVAPQIRRPSHSIS